MEITFIRHAQSRSNAGIGHEKNCALSDLGVNQAKELTGAFDIVILSPLRRAIQTYSYSNIKAGGVMMTDLVRECCPIGDPPNYLEQELITIEDEKSFKLRVNKAIQFLRCLPYDNICVISHHDFVVELTKILGDPVYLDNAQSVVISNFDLLTE